MSSHRRRRQQEAHAGRHDRMLHSHALLLLPHFGVFFAAASAALFSSARAPASVFLTPLLPSWQACSKIGPTDVVIAASAVHRAAHAAGSAPVKRYPRVLPPS